MKKGLISGIVICLFLISSFAIININIVSADDGTCVENAFQCDGPGGETTYASCDKTVCDVCPVNSLGYKTECTGRVNINNPPIQNYHPASFSTDLLNFLKDSLRKAIGEGTPTPSAKERMNAIIILIIFLIIILAILSILFNLLKSLMRKLNSRKSMSEARPSYLQQKGKREDKSEGGICKFPHRKRK